MLTQPTSDALNVEAIQSRLRTQSIGKILHVLVKTPSTNLVGLSLADSGEPHGSVILAEHQTAGKGRLDRSWISPPNKNIYCSVILKKPGLQEHLSWVPLVTGLAIAEAIQMNHSTTLSLKWPNDLLVRDKKLGGILCQGTIRKGDASALVVGFGINVNSTSEDFPPELHNISTSLYQESGRFCNRNSLLSSILNNLEKWYKQLAMHELDVIHSAYSASCSTLGTDVCCTLTESHDVNGRAIEIGKDGSLQIAPFEAGAKKNIILHSADITHIR